MKAVKMFIVKYSSGSHDDYEEWDIFITSKKSTATKYVTKFNRKVKYWQSYYSQFEYDMGGFKWIKDEYVESHYTRWNQIRKINRCYWEEIEIR